MAGKPILGLAVAIMACAATWLYTDRVLIPHQKAEAVIRGTPRGNLSDLYPRWLASRELLLDHRDPYSSEITREIQIGYYGRPLDPSLKNDPRDQQAFAYPVYISFLLYPTVGLPFEEVQAIFRWFLGVLTAASVVLWLQALRWRVSTLGVTIAILLVFSLFPVVQGIKLQQLSLLVGPLLAGSIFCLAKRRQIPAGILLGVATIKPQIIFPLALWLTLWAFAKSSVRWKFVASALATVAVLVSAGELVLPHWVPKFVNAVRAYLDYNGSRTLLDGLLTHWTALPIEAALVILATVYCWQVRQSGAASEEFYRATALVLAVTILVIPTIAPYNQVLLLPGAFFILRTWRPSLRVNPVVRTVRSAAAGFVVLSLVAGAILAIGSFFTTGVQHYWMIPLWATIVVPLLLTLTLALLIFFPPEPVRGLQTDN